MLYCLLNHKSVVFNYNYLSKNAEVHITSYDQNKLHGMPLDFSLTKRLLYVVFVLFIIFWLKYTVYSDDL